jgi:hypothetical protein
MSQHTTPVPAPVPLANLDPVLFDLVPGTPPVPVTVWRSTRTSAGQPVSAQLAAQLVAAFSRPGDTIVDLTGARSVADACAASGRRLSQLTRDDTDPPPPDHRPDGAVCGRADLVITTWASRGGDAHDRLTRLTVAAELLRAGGCLVLVTGLPTGMPAVPVDLRPVTDVTTLAGLGYLQHIVVCDADTDSDHLIYPTTGDQATAHAAATGRGVVHLRVHADMYAFHRPVLPAGSPGPTGSRRFTGGAGA